MKDLLAVTGALSDQNRLRVVAALREQELCACHIAVLLKLAQSTVSRHMDLLVRAGLVIARKEGRWMYYRLPRRGDSSSSAVRESLRWVLKHLAHDPQVLKDKEVLVDVKKPCTRK